MNKLLENDENMGKILDIIVKLSSPKKVIIFGSRATNNYHKDSDYDFLILKDKIQNEREITRKIYRALYDSHINKAVDLVVSDIEKFKINKDKDYMVYYWANKEGVVLYE